MLWFDLGAECNVFLSILAFFWCTKLIFKKCIGKLSLVGIKQEGQGKDCTMLGVFLEEEEVLTSIRHPHLIW